KGTNLRQVIIYRDKFMPGLKVLDGADNELVIMPNNYTKELLRLNAVEKNEYDTYNKVLNHKLYAVWIQFPKGKEVGYNETIIIKFVYYDQETPKEVPAKDAKKNWKFFFSVPRFSVIKKTLTGQNVDTFIVINVCEELEVDHQFVKKDKV